jgi:hypothetical protein
MDEKDGGGNGGEGKRPQDPAVDVLKSGARVTTVGAADRTFGKAKHAQCIQHVEIGSPPTVATVVVGQRVSDGDVTALQLPVDASQVAVYVVGGAIVKGKGKLAYGTVKDGRVTVLAVTEELPKLSTVGPTLFKDDDGSAEGH